MKDVAIEQQDAQEEAHKYCTTVAFCDLLIEAYCEGENGTQWETLMDTLKQNLPCDIFQDVFGERF